MPPTSLDLEREILAAGWRFDSQKGSHRQYVHPSKFGKVTIPFHKGKDLFPREPSTPFVNKPD